MMVPLFLTAYICISSHVGSSQKRNSWHKDWKRLTLYCAKALVAGVINLKHLTFPHTGHCFWRAMIFMSYIADFSNRKTQQLRTANCQVSWLDPLVLFLMLVVSWRELVGPDTDMPLFPWVILFAQGRNDTKRTLRRFSTLLLQQKITNMKTARSMLTMSVMYQ
jgi:hypothetical protein